MALRDAMRAIGEALGDAAIALGVDVALKQWWTKTLDGTHRSDVCRILVEMDDRGLKTEVNTLLRRLCDRLHSCESPTEDDVVRALHSAIPKKDEWKDNVRVVSVDWNKLDEAINSFIWFANLPDNAFLVAVATNIHDPIRQLARVVGHDTAAGLKTVAEGAGRLAEAIDEDVFGKLNNWLDSQWWVRR